MNDPNSPRQGADANPQPASPSRPEVLEDPGTQALSEALRSSFVVVKVLMIGVVIYFLCSGIFTVGPQEKVMILRFGKPVGGERALLGPGLHRAFPEPIDEKVRIPVGQVQAITSTVGWYATTAAQEAAKNEAPPGPSLNPATDGYLLTADGNIIHARGTLRYRISEPGIHYMFDFASASNVVQDAFNNALVYATAHYTVDNILTHDFAGYREKIRMRLEQLIEQQQLGIIVDQIDVRAIPPRQLSANFDAVLQAGIQRSKALNEAKSYANQTISRAKGEAAARILAGETERTRLVEFVAADARRFTDLLPAYRSNPELFIRQRQTETLQRVLTNAETRKWVLPPAVAGKPRTLRLELNEPPRPKPPEPAAKEDKH
jgi:membrane protease subunit HflK